MSTIVASQDGITGLDETADGDPVQQAGDDFGRAWARLFVNGAAVSTANPMPVSINGGGAVAASVQGIIAHDVADNEATNFPVKVGGHATAAQRPDVSEDDMADASVDLAGRLRVAIASPQGDANTGSYTGIGAFNNNAVVVAVHERDMGLAGDAAVVTDATGSVLAFLRGIVSRASTAAQGLFAVGNVAHSDVDSNNPVKVGGRAVASIDTGIVGGVAVSDRTDAAYTITGLAGVAAVGTIASGSADAGNPLKVGGIGLLQAPTLVDNADRVDRYHDTAGRGQTNQELSMAGENIALNVLRTVNGLLSVEQESTEQSNPAALGTLAASLIVRASAGRIYAVSIANTAAVGIWCLVVNNATAAASSVVDRFYVPALGSAQADYSGWNGIYCDTGMGIYLATTPHGGVTAGAVGQIHVNFF